MENAHTIDLRPCFDARAPRITHYARMLNTLDYYTAEAKAEPRSEFMDIFTPWTAFTLDNVLTPTECQRLIALTEGVGYKDLTTYRKGYRDNQRLSIHSAAAAEILWQRVSDLLPGRIRVLNGEGRDHDWVPSHLNPLLRFGKYNPPTDAFAAHKDSGYDDTGGMAMLTFMVYLNSFRTLTGEPSGRTRMLTLNKTLSKSGDADCTVLDAVTPTAGRCVIFNQRSIYHDGESVGTCDRPKYILRTDICYKPHVRPLE
jgi:hypothetical protein